MPRFHSRDHSRLEKTRRADYDRQQEQYIAQKSYELYQDISKEAEHEADEMLSPIPAFTSGRLDDPADVQQLNQALAKATARLRSQERVKQIVESGVSAEAMRNTSKLLLEFNSTVKEYQSRLDRFRDKVPHMVKGLEEERDRKGLSGINLLQINTKIEKLKNVVPLLERKVSQAVEARDRLLGEYSDAVKEAAIFRIKLARLLGSLDGALKEGRSEVIMVCNCCIQIAISFHKQPFTIRVDEAKSTFEFSRAEVQDAEDRSQWDQVRRIREAQNRVRIMERIMSPKPDVIGDGDDAGFE